MAWKSVSPMDERTRFVLEAQLDLWTITDLCQRYGISRNPGNDVLSWCVYLLLDREYYGSSVRLTFMYAYIGIP